MNPYVEQAFKFIHDNEGGWSNHASDKGGATNLGVTIKQFRVAAAEMDGHNFDIDHDGDIDADDLKLMETPLAMDIFEKYYWLPNFTQLPRRVAIKTADYGFNMGPTSGVKRLQMAINILASRLSAPALEVDGRLGPNTCRMATLCHEEVLLRALQEEGKRFYTTIIAKDPTQEVFRQGWTNRAMRLPA